MVGVSRPAGRVNPCLQSQKGEPLYGDNGLWHLSRQRRLFSVLRQKTANWDVDANEYWDEERDGWDPTDNQLNKYLKMNRPALEKWREATEKENYQIAPIAKLSEAPYITKIQARHDRPPLLDGYILTNRRSV